MRVRVELLTPPGGVGGIAVVALRGPDRHRQAAEILRRAGDQNAAFERDCGSSPGLALLWIAGEVVDEVLVVDRPSIDQLEIHLHGSRAVLDALASSVELIEAPEPEAPAERLLLGALSHAQLELALEQRGHDFDGFLERLREAPLAERGSQAAAALRRSVVSCALAEPQKLVLVGARNAGKSTLLNRLLFAERALVGELPGLTRDPVRELTTLAGYPYSVVDTAGVGEGLDEIDRRAQERTERERDAWAWQLLVVDAKRGIDASDRGLATARTLWVRNKVDLDGVPAWPGELAPVVETACLDAADAPAIRDRVGEALRGARGLPQAGPVGGPAAMTREQLARLERLADVGGPSP